MKILVLSDTHGHAPALRDALRLAATEGATKLFLLGDLLGGRPYSCDTDELATAIMLRAYADRAVAVCGNCDSAIDAPRTKLALPPFAWVEEEGKTFYLHHGHSCATPVGGEGKRPDFVLSGHTHTPSLARANGTVWLNPGSCAYPRGSATRTCALITDTAVKILALPDGAVLDELALDSD